VVRWESEPRGTGRERPEVYWTERDGGAGGSAPSEYGLDADGRILARERLEPHVPARQRAVGGTSIWVNANSERRALLVFDGGLPGRLNLISLTRPVYEGERLVGVDSWFSARHGSGGWARETYKYDDHGRVARVDAVRDFGGSERRTRLSAEFADDGELLTLSYVALDEHGSPTDEPGIAFRRSTPKAVMAAVKLVASEMPARVLEWASRVAPSAPIYSLGIVYGTDSSGFVPGLGLGTDDERRAWIASVPKPDRAELLWNPAEYRCFDPAPKELTGDSSFAEACQLLAQEWRATLETAEPRRFLVRIAKQLRRDLPRAGLDLTAPFAVVVVDDELEDLDRNLRTTISKANRAMLEVGN
jgi:hypothetical protein